MKRPNGGGEMHLVQFIVANQEIMRSEFFESGGTGAELRFDLSKYAGLDSGPFGLLPGIISVRHRGTGDDDSKVWVATYDAAELVFVFEPMARLHSVFILDKKRTEKEFGPLASAIRAALTAANATATDRALAHDALLVLSMSKRHGIGHWGAQALGHALVEHAFAGPISSTTREGTLAVALSKTPTAPAGHANAHMKPLRDLVERIEQTVTSAADAAALCDALGAKMHASSPLTAPMDGATDAGVLLAKMIHTLDARAQPSWDAAQDRVLDLWETASLAMYRCQQGGC